MASAASKIQEVLERYGESYDTRKGGTVWEVQGTPVISHKTLERIAAQAKITFDQPTILRSERDEAVILVTGMIPTGKKLEDEQPDAPDWVHGPTYRTEWSIGEALVNVNYRVSGKQAAYVYAMAEKRAKDRVILKLVELHGLAFSEEEADEFKASNQGRQDVPEPDPLAEAAARYITDCERAIDAETNRVTLLEWWKSDQRKDDFRKFQLTPEEGRALTDRVRARAEALTSNTGVAA